MQSLKDYLCNGLLFYYKGNRCRRFNEGGKKMITDAEAKQEGSSKRNILTIVLLVISTWAALKIGQAVPLLGNSIAAILIGAIIRHTPLYDLLEKKITGFVSSYFLKTGIVLLGFTLSLRILSEVGPGVLVLLGVGVIVSIGLSVILGKLFKVESILALLIGIGTSICGGSAIVATAPLMEADEKDIAVSVTTMLIYSMMALILLPTIGTLLNHTDQMYGMFAGAAVNDTASVVATAFDWSDAAGGFATITKLTRTLYIVPVTLGVIALKFKKEAASSTASGEKFKISFKQIIGLIPMFVVLFVGAVIFATIFTIPADILSSISSISKIFMTIALVTIGLGVHVKEIKDAGLRPVLIGGLCWAAVVINSAIFISFLYS